jgi:hypothetical protein
VRSVSRDFVYGFFCAVVIVVLIVLLTGGFHA